MGALLSLFAQPETHELIRDYGNPHRPCPEGWTPIHGNEHCDVQCNLICQAPAWYKGPCPGVQKFGKLVQGFGFGAGMHPDEASQRAVAKACGVEWGYKGKCDRDWDQPCPEGWTSHGRLCEAPDTFTGGPHGNCPKKVAMFTKSISDKDAWEKRCAQHWFFSIGTLLEARKY